MKFLSAIVFALVASLCQGQDLIGVLEAEGQTTLLSLIDLAGLTADLQGADSLTLFVPKQEVFDSLPAELVEAITADPELLAQVLLYHAVVGEAPSSALANDLVLETAQGAGLRVNLYDVDGETVATVAGVPIDLSRVDIAADNGLIHFLDFIILNIPIGDTIETVDALGAESFTALLYAVESVGLVDTIVEATDVSVLAPIDSDGFNTDVVDSLLADPDALTAILLDHVASEVVFSAGIGASKEITTAGGNTLLVQYNDEKGYFITDVDGNELADVLAGDIPTTQGVLHIIDRPIIL